MKKTSGNYMKPFKLCGNIYFVGYYTASSHLIDTGDGLILLDTGYPQELDLLIENIRQLGFDPKDVKYILHTHGHIDHCGATKGFVQLYGSKTFIGSGDEDYVNGKLDLTWAKEVGQEYKDAFEADVILHDGDVVELGNTKVQIVSAPGHTPGTLALFFETEENGKKYLAGMHGGVGTNSMEIKWLDSYGLSHSCRQDFLAGLEKVKQYDVEVFLGNHCWNNDTRGKYKKSLISEENPFIDPQGWKKFLDDCKNEVEQMIADNV